MHNITMGIGNDLNFNMALRNVLGSLDMYEPHESAADYAITASSGTSLTELASGVMRVDQGGPLNVQFAVSDGSTSLNGTVNVQQGQCFGENYASDSPIDIVGCN